MNKSTAPNIAQPGLVSFGLLCGVGILIATMLPLAKVALSQGMTPLAYAFWQALGGGLILAVWQGGGIRLRGTVIRYYLLSAFTAIAVPNVLAFVVVAQIGSGLTATLYALPSLMTYAMALLLKMEPPSRARATGLAVGVVGCLAILSPNPAGVDQNTVPWLLLGMLIPLSLAMGNIYRTTHWPEGAAPEELAPGMLLGGALLIFLVILTSGGMAQLGVTRSDTWGVLALQAVLTAVAYRGFFILQQRTSPTFLSQLGFVITPAGLVFGVVFFDESIGWSVWVGVVILMAGVLLANRPQKVSYATE